MRIVFIALFFFNLCAYGQSVFENDRPAVKWKQINTNNFRLLFPDSFEEKAQDMANLLEAVHAKESVTMGGISPKKVTFVFRNRYASSNGFATLGPRRSEIYTMPPHNHTFLGTNDWLNKVVIHEFRHIVQFSHSRRGWNKLFYYLFGENTVAAMAFAAAPSWFWEGDAVAIETAFTPSGRGRLPAFSQGFKANAVEGKKYNYNKQYLRSYKDFVPNHYVLGGHFIPYLRRETKDPDVWEKISAHAFKVPFFPFTFSRGMKRETGLSLRKNYEKMMSHLESDWSAETAAVEKSVFQRISKPNKAFTNYRLPQILSDGRLVVLKTGIDDIPGFCILDSLGRETKLHVPGPLNSSGMLSVNNDMLVWNEFRYDPRWRTESYSVIKTLNIRTGKVKTLTSDTRYSGASISEDGTRIATVLSTPEYQHRVMLIDAQTGMVLKQFENDSNDLFSYARFGAGDDLVAIRSNSEGKSIVQINALTGQITELTPGKQENMGQPFLSTDYIFYSSDYSGIDNIYAIDRATLKHYQVTSSTYGAYSPVFDEHSGRLFYNDYDVNGMRVVSVVVDRRRWSAKEDVPVHHNTLFDAVIAQEGQEGFISRLPDENYQVTDYRKASGMINPHSWGPYVDTSLESLEIGVFSKDVLSTTSLYAGYSWDVFENTGIFSTKLSYQGWYPIVDVEYEQGSRVLTRSLDDSTNVDFTWKEKGLLAGVRIPLKLTRSRYHTSFEGGTYLGIREVSDFKNSIDGDGRIINDTHLFRDMADNGYLNWSSTYLSFSYLMKQGYRDLKPKWGQYFRIAYDNTLGAQFDGAQFAVRTRTYLPGLFRHHSLNGFWAYQNKKFTNYKENYLFRNSVYLPRGLKVNTFQHFYSMGVNYEMPVLCPDWSVGPFLYMKRIRINFFGDYAYGFTSLPDFKFFTNQSYYSTGAELRFDFNVMRFLPNIEMGVRYSYGFDQGDRFELIFPVIDL